MKCKTAEFAAQICCLGGKVCYLGELFVRNFGELEYNGFIVVDRAHLIPRG